MPTSTTATSTGASANAAYAIADDGLEEAQRVRLDASTRCVYGATSLKARTNSSSVSGSPSMQIRSLIRSRWGLVKRPVRRSSARSSVSIIRAGRGLAVGAGQVDHRVGALRVAEQLGEGADPVERGLEPGLGPAREQGVLGLGEGLGEAGLRGQVGHRAPTL